MTAPGLLPSKLYFRIGEVAGLVGVEPHVLRYWEREFRSIRPTKSAKGQRVYSRRDVESLLRVRELLYGQGFTIAGARKRLRDKDDAGQETTGAAADRVMDAPSSLHRAEAARIDATRVESQVEGPATGRVRRELEALKAEVETFLSELSHAP